MSKARLVLVAAALSLAFAPKARAQARTYLSRPEPLGVQVPPTSIAVIDSPFAMSLNPAGLVLGPGGISYVHADGDSTLPHPQLGDGLFLSLGGLHAGSTGSAALGFSAEWLRTGHPCIAADPCSRRISLALAGGTPSFAFGLAYHWYSSAESPAIDRLGTLDLGLTIRPAKWLSLAGTVLAVNAPQDVPRIGTLGAALRPFGSWFTLGADYQFGEFGGFTHGRFDYFAGLSYLGFDLVGNVAQDVFLSSGVRPLALLVALRGGFGPVDAFAGGGAVTSGGTGGGWLAGIEVRNADGPWVFGAPKTAQTLDLKEALEGPSQLDKLIGRTGGLDAYTKLALRLQRLETDDSLDTLILRIRGIDDVSLGRVEELRALIAEVRGHGKHVVAWMDGGGDTEYYLALAAERVYAAPASLVEINGLSSDHYYLRPLLDKIGAKPEFVKIGEFKSAPEQFTNGEASAPAAEQTNALLDDQQARYLAAVEAARHLTAAQLQKILAVGLMTTEQAVKAGLFDGTIGSMTALDQVVAQVAGRELPRESAGPESEAPRVWGTLPAVALVEVKGDIVGGNSPGMASAQRIARELREAAEEPSVKAIVLRVESPGGDVAASELIYQAAREAGKKKPLVASFGDVAASGGYYVGVAADTIVAEPSTITGSIGVFAGKADLSGLLGKIGVNVQTFKKAEHADIFSLTRPWTPEETATVQGVVEDFYRTFLQRVAEGRKMAPAEVDEVARGRVWTGAQAKSRRLVDELGGLEDALRIAREKAGIAPDAPVTVSGVGGTYVAPRVVNPTTPQAPGALFGMDPVEALELLAAGTGTDEAVWLQAQPLVEALTTGRPMALAVDLPRAR